MSSLKELEENCDWTKAKVILWAEELTERLIEYWNWGETNPWISISDELKAYRFEEEFGPAGEVTIEDISLKEQIKLFWYVMYHWGNDQKHADVFSFAVRFAEKRGFSITYEDISKKLGVRELWKKQGLDINKREEDWDEAFELQDKLVESLWERRKALIDYLLEQEKLE